MQYCPISKSIARPSINIPSMPMRSPSSQSWLRRAMRRNIGLGETPEVGPGVSVTEASKIGGKMGLSTLAGIVVGGYLIYITLVKR